MMVPLVYLLIGNVKEFKNLIKVVNNNEENPHRSSERLEEFQRNFREKCILR